MRKLTLKKKILKEGDELSIKEAKSEIQPLATFRIKYFRDGKPMDALELWYLESETP